ncbi:hypothetical protein EIN_326200 [Entamoeba invadens IP1]|uniref:Uncharacterized protein n=1 Tax=Entamoeba invadens IP1 TaxID=370355 RepID=L7FLI5_ENTIV|nr:hypothetical protein EIN_326200 [Entamoeba invadens IP1]ELP87559.1 hypothetical protein EIN_326200 [Entamoeba invadens IP1]|eukprot:XP_004254330.1 hypothetical protein EIN_326200 [Entamoeba invadens IP1]
MSVFDEIVTMFFGNGYREYSIRDVIFYMFERDSTRFLTCTLSFHLTYISGLEIIKKGRGTYRINSECSSEDFDYSNREALYNACMSVLKDTKNAIKEVKEVSQHRLFIPKLESKLKLMTDSEKNSVDQSFDDFPQKRISCETNRRKIAVPTKRNVSCQKKEIKDTEIMDVINSNDSNHPIVIKDTEKIDSNPNVVKESADVKEVLKEVLTMEKITAEPKDGNVADVNMEKITAEPKDDNVADVNMEEITAEPKDYIDELIDEYINS